MARIWTQAVEYSPQTDSGRRKKLIPGARSWCVVVTMLIPVRMEDIPRTKTANTARGTSTVVRRL